MNYPSEYHAACAELVDFGASVPDRATRARNLISRALRALRRTEGHSEARRLRQGMLFICGHFPDKEGTP